MISFDQLFKQSMDEGTGLNFHLTGGHVIAGIVTSNNAATVVARNQEFGTILILISHIVAVTKS
jgi:hypothetical protein